MSVPVLSVQRIFIEPRFWIEFKFLMMVFSFDIATAPLAKQVVTNIGSISGVSPTATAKAKRLASIQSPFVKPLMNRTIGTITSIKRISTQETELTPFSNVVLSGFSVTV